MYGSARADSSAQSSAQDSVDCKQKYDISLSRYVRDCLIPGPSHQVTAANNWPHLFLSILVIYNRLLAIKNCLAGIPVLIQGLILQQESHPSLGLKFNYHSNFSAFGKALLHQSQIYFLLDNSFIENIVLSPAVHYTFDMQTLN